MIKELLWTAALLAPGLAYGQISAPLDPPVVPAGGSAPVAPAPAQASGFTTCVVCMDFTQATGGVWLDGAAPAGVNAAQTNTWLDCGGAGNPIWYQDRYGVFNLNYTGPCPVITTDSSGTPVLQINWGSNSISIPSNNFANNGLEIGASVLGHIGRLGTLPPTISYTEWTARVTVFPVTTGTYPGSYFAPLWQGGNPGMTQTTSGPWSWIEFDSHEICCALANAGGWGSQWYSLYSGGTFFNNHFMTANWSGSFPRLEPSGLPLNTDVKVGMRVTTDGSTAVYKCIWINDQEENCRSASIDGTNLYAWQVADAAARNSLLFEVGWNNQGDSNSVTTPGDLVMQIKSINVWSCLNWRTTACHTSSPDPGGY